MNTTTVVERKGSSIVYRSDTTYEIPDVDLLTFLFDSPHCSAVESTLLHADAANLSLSLNKSQLRDLTKRIAHTLRYKYGVGASGKFEKVTCIAGSSYMLPAIFYGCIAAGGIFSSVTSSSTVQELARLIRLAPSDLVLCSPETQDVAVKAAKDCGVLSSRVLVIDSENLALREVVSGSNALNARMLDWERLTTREAVDTTPICLIYSSGTTGLPKGVPLSHRNMIAEATISCGMLIAQMRKHAPDVEIRTLAHLPTAHIAGMQGYFVNPFYMGAPTYWMAKFDFDLFLEYNRRYQITFMFTVPPIYLLIAKSPAVKDHFGHMELAISGAAPMGKELQEAASAKFKKGQTYLTQTWGMSETTGSATLLNYGERELTGSVSGLLPNMAARFANDDGTDVPPGQEGELLIKGPILFKGYHNNPEANKDAFDSKGWFRTGDIGYFKGGLFYIVDRKKELIKYKAFKVAPAELEALLLSHSDILDAAVIGVKAEGTEVPRAYVVADQNQISGEEIQQYVKGQVASYKQLRGGVVFLDAIPKSPSGKILRKDLRSLAKEEAQQRKSKL